MWVVSGCPRSGTSLMMDLLRVTFGEERILGKKFPQEEHIEQMKKQNENETDHQYAARMYIHKKLRDEEKIKKDLEESKDMNPNGFWEMLYTVKGCYFRFFDSDRLEKILTEEKKSICKIVSQGLIQSDPIYIDKIIYMIRHPRAVAKSQEKLKRQFPFSDGGKILIDNEEVKVHTPEMYINVTAMAAKWFVKYPNVEVKFVYFDELISEPKKVLTEVQEFLGEGDFEKAIAQINPKLNRSYPENIDSPFWEDAEFIYNNFIQQNYNEIIEYMKVPERMIHRKNNRWYCCRINRLVVENECLNCINNEVTRENFKIFAEQKKINWKEEPCIFECSHHPENNPITIEESIANNSWNNIAYNDSFNITDSDNIQFSDFKMPKAIFEKMVNFK